MKLVEIKDIREDQVWIRKDTPDVFLIPQYVLRNLEQGTAYWIFLSVFEDEGRSVCETSVYCEEKANLFETHELIGFLGITHKLENNKLIEIPRQEFEVDDVVENNEGYFQVIDKIYQDNSRHLLGDDPEYTEPLECLTKVGILGATHEFINNKLIKE